MRYVVTAHGCYRKNLKIDLYNVRLAMYASENEYLKYAPTYPESFCRKSYNKKKKAYKPLFGVKDSYYEMSFGKEQGDKMHSFVECCSTHEPIYDFANGDLLLSDVIELIRHHARINDYHGQIHLSVLSCNTPCSGEVPDVGTLLHRSTSYEAGLEPPEYNFTTTRKKSRRLRKKNMTRVPKSTRNKAHIPKAGNMMVHKETHEKVRIPPGLTDANRMAIRRTHYFIPDLQSGDFVYYGKTYVVEQISTEEEILYYEIRNVRAGADELFWVKSDEVYKVEVTTREYDPVIAVGDYVHYGKTFVIDQIAEENSIVYYQIRNTLTNQTFWVDAREVLKIEF